jgi:hypothetical protein
MSRIARTEQHAQLGQGPLETGRDGLITHCIAYVLYHQVPAGDVLWEVSVNFSPNIIRPNTCVCASVCVADIFDPKKPIPLVLEVENVCPRIFSVTCLTDKLVIRGNIAGSPKPLDLMLNMMIRNRN